MPTITTPTIVLEPAARAFADATANPPYLFDLGPVEGRKVVDEAQSGDIAKPEVDISDHSVAGGPNGDVAMRIVRPQGCHRCTAGRALHPWRRLGLRHRKDLAKLNRGNGTNVAAVQSRTGCVP